MTKERDKLADKRLSLEAASLRQALSETNVKWVKSEQMNAGALAKVLPGRYASKTPVPRPICDEEFVLSFAATVPTSFISVGKQVFASIMGVWLAAAYNSNGIWTWPVKTFVLLFIFTGFAVGAVHAIAAVCVSTTPRSPSDDAGCFGRAGEVRGRGKVGVESSRACRFVRCLQRRRAIRPRSRRGNEQYLAQRVRRVRQCHPET